MNLYSSPSLFLSVPRSCHTQMAVVARFARCVCVLTANARRLSMAWEIGFNLYFDTNDFDLLCCVRRECFGSLKCFPDRWIGPGVNETSVFVHSHSNGRFSRGTACIINRAFRRCSSMVPKQSATLLQPFPKMDSFGSTTQPPANSLNLKNFAAKVHSNECGDKLYPGDFWLRRSCTINPFRHRSARNKDNRV